MDLFDFTPSAPPDPDPGPALTKSPATRRPPVRRLKEPAAVSEDSGSAGTNPPRETAEEKALSVTQLTQRIRSLLEQSIGSVWVRGEISNCRRQSSGHFYFTLKDGGAQLSCVLFRGNAKDADAVLLDGFEIQAFGDISVYEARGQYQMIVRRVQAAGQGALQAKFETMKRRLQAEGLFDSSQKRAIPRLPHTVAIITSPTGAAIQDMLNILSRRAPWLQILIYPVRVQGAGAAEEIAAAVRHLSTRPDSLPEIDTLVVARGGGSLEDLWAFNEEAVARAIYECPLPVISAVGHEIDFTISDFTADLRAPTPSAAAELLTPGREELQNFLQSCRDRLHRRLQQTLEHHRRVLDLTARGVLQRDAERLLLPWRQALDESAESLKSALSAALQEHRETLTAWRHRLDLRRPDRLLEERAVRLEVLRNRLQMRVQTALEHLQTDHRRRAALLRTLGPDAVLARGFSYTLDESGHPVMDAAALRPGAELTTRLARGTVKSTVRTVENGM